MGIRRPRTETTTRTTPAGVEYLVNKNGFPVVHCGRCGGSGDYSFNPMDGTTCFGCHGSAFQTPAGLPSQLATEWSNAVRAAKQVNTAAYWSPVTREITCEVQVGDQVAHHGDKEWSTVAGVRITRRITGSAFVGLNPDGSPTLHTLTLESWLTYADGRRERGGYLLRRRPDVAALHALRDDLAARARAAYEERLDRKVRAHR